MRRQFDTKYGRGILVAGYGEITADQYWQFAKRKDALMCDYFLQTCLADRDGQDCRTGRGLWQR